MKLVKTTLVSQDGLYLFGVFLRNLLSILVFLRLVDRVERNAEVSEKSVGCNDLLLLRVDIGCAALLARRLLLVEFLDNVRKFVLDSLILLQSSSEGPALGLHLSQAARQLFVGRRSGYLVIIRGEVGRSRLSFRIGLSHIENCL